MYLFTSFMFLISTFNIQVDHEVIEEFRQWHEPSSSSESETSTPLLFDLYPGITSTTRVLPQKVRDFLIRNFKTYPLTPYEWEGRWRQVESRILATGSYDVLSSLKSLEDLGNEAFRDFKFQNGLTLKLFGSISASEARRFFLMGDRQRQTEFKSLTQKVIRDINLYPKKLNFLLRGHNLDRSLKKDQKAKFLAFLWHFYRQLEGMNWGEIDILTIEELNSLKSDFNQEMGFSMPEMKEIFEFMAQIKRTLK